MKWPTRPDGKPKRMGEMTREEQRKQFLAAGRRLKKEFERPEVREGIRRVLGGAEK